MNIEEFNKKIDRLIAEIPKWQQEVTNDIALTNLASLIAKRVVETGVNEKGGSFSGYSTKPTLAGRSSFTSTSHFNKVAGSKRKRKALSWVTVNGNSLFVVDGGYKEIRAIEGRETGHKSFERTGDMWKKFGIVKTRQSGNQYTVTLGGTNAPEQEKMNWNSEQEGINILGATKEEEKKIALLYEERLVKFINKNL